MSQEAVYHPHPLLINTVKQPDDSNPSADCQCLTTNDARSLESKSNR